ncbi:MAG: 2'-5' RNA ligase family protein [Candidatus Peribacteraceae bacterium]|nr:2'-5' RNA ligase family protein [Candidatus Peribacteraceae bacterium]
MVEANGYSLWIVPEGEVYEKMSEIISKFSKRLSTPVFSPHVTLVGEVEGTEEEVISKTEKLASMIKPFEIKLSGVDKLDHFFRCIFVHAEKTPELMKANEYAKEIFGMSFEYMPHLSLVYRNLSDEQKEEIISEIGKIDKSFLVNSIHVVLTNGQTEDWKKVRKVFIK